MLEKFSLRDLSDHIKLCKLRISYFLLNRLKHISILRSISLLLFIFTIILSLSVLIPNFFHALPILGEWHSILELNGDIFIINANSSEKSAAAFAIVEIGGYKTEANPEGSYSIKFPSKVMSDIPVIVTFNNKSWIRHVTFEPMHFSQRAVLYLDGN